VQRSVNIGENETDSFFFIDEQDSLHSQVDSKENYLSECIAQVSCIETVLDLNLKQENGYSDCSFSWFFSIHPEKCWDSTSNYAAAVSFNILFTSVSANHKIIQ
jgi:hypothetical protein